MMPAIHDPKIKHEPMPDAVWFVPSGELAELTTTKPATATMGHIRPDADHHETPQRAPATNGAHDPSPNGSSESQGQRSRRGSGAVLIPALYFPDHSLR